MNDYDDDSSNSSSGGDNRQGGFSDNREKHTAVCSECGQECEVPFKPTEGRPIYCNECFKKHRKPRSYGGGGGGSGGSRGGYGGSRGGYGGGRRNDY